MCSRSQRARPHGGNVRLFTGGKSMSITTTTLLNAHRHAWGWLTARATLALVVIVLLSLSVVGLEARLQATTSDSAWMLSSE
jgi:hypothetical protein